MESFVKDKGEGYRLDMTETHKKFYSTVLDISKRNDLIVTEEEATILKTYCNSIFNTTSGLTGGSKKTRIKRKKTKTRQKTRTKRKKERRRRRQENEKKKFLILPELRDGIKIFDRSTPNNNLIEFSEFQNYFINFGNITNNSNESDNNDSFEGINNSVNNEDVLFDGQSDIDTKSESDESIGVMNQQSPMQK